MQKSEEQVYGDVGVVVIGRNEGERLRLCLASVPEGVVTVYVDSASRDDSVAMASGLGADVVELDASRPYTAARSRNAGVQRIRERAPWLQYVQFVDGDCELQPGWFDAGWEFLVAAKEVAVVFGHLREREPERSVYNLLCDMEWAGPVGDVAACGGIAMMRLDAFEAAGGFREDLIAGEEPELCVRLRQAGWRVVRVDVVMATHDAAMTRFSQWWRRSARGGHAAAEGAYLHGPGPDHHGVRQVRSALFWGVGLPLAALSGTLVVGPVSLMLLLVYPLQVVRLSLSGPRGPRENWYRALFLLVGKFPEAWGAMRFWARRCIGAAPRLIEYK